MINLLARCIETALIIAEFPPDERHLRAFDGAGKPYRTRLSDERLRFLCYAGGMMSINPEALMASGRQCGVVVVAAGIIQGFTTPETAVAVIMASVGTAVILVNGIKVKEEKEE
ncbi:MAG: hypothetical protein OXU83_00035 [Gammaproteobacteria bacterium]|nr:hypothetical protein [Gammaproteobacteria bacterium]